MTLSLILLAFALNQTDEPPLVDVCTVLSHLQDFSGKVVRVTGEHQYGLEVVGLYGKDCAGTLYIGGNRWPWALNTVSETPRSKSVERFGQISRAANCTQNPCKIVGEFVGLLVTNSSVLRGQGELGGPPLGFGHLNVFPAQLRMTEVRTITISFDQDEKKP